MEQLKKDDDTYLLTKPKKFRAEMVFTDTTIETVFNFAYEMAYGDGQHRNHRSGGQIKRNKSEIFIDTFQGKLSEFSVCYMFYIHNRGAYEKLDRIDLSIHQLGVWDDIDLILDDIKFSVKSTKHYGHLLLLETKDWNTDAEYIPNLSESKSSHYDYFVLVRVSPDAQGFMRKNNMSRTDEPIDKSTLFKLISSVTWEFDIAGYITNDDLKTVIAKGFILPQNSHFKVNPKGAGIKMDAENYYVQSGDMKNFKELLCDL